MGIFDEGLFFGGTEPLEPSVDRGCYISQDDSANRDHSYASDEDDSLPHEITRAANNPPSIHDSDDWSHPRAATYEGALSAPLLVDYDSDDDRIIMMKQQGYTDEAIANKLTRCHSRKSVSSRWQRIRKAIESAEDERLDEELSDWHVNEDDHLAESYAAVDKKYEEEIKKLLRKKWKDVSTHLGQILGRRKYTAKACEERFGAVKAGTALLPIELDPDQQGRRVMRETRVNAAKQLRAERIAEAQFLENQEKLRIKEKKRATDEKDRQIATLKRKRDAERVETARIRQERRDACVKKRAAVKAARAHYQLVTKWQRHKTDAERAIYKQLTGRNMLGQRVNHNHEDVEEAEDDDVFTDSDVESHDESELARDEDLDVEEDEPAADRNGKVARIQIRRTPVTKESLLNPRSVMTTAELEVLLHSRRLPRRSSRETHAQVVARLAFADAQLSSKAISELLGQYFDRGKGGKEVKCRRLQEHNAKRSSKGRERITSSDPDFIRTYEGYAGEFRGMVDEATGGTSTDGIGS